MATLSRNYTLRDLIAIGVLVAGGVANYFILRNDLERQDERIRENAAAIKLILDTAHETAVRNAIDTERHKGTAKDLEDLERRVRRYHRSR